MPRSQHGLAAAWRRGIGRVVVCLCALSAVLSMSSSVAAVAPNVAIVRGDYYTNDLFDILSANGAAVTDVTSYTAASLAAYSHVIHYGNTYTDMSALETYVQNGGTLIEQPWFWWNHSPPPSLLIFNFDGSPNHYTPYPGVTVLDAGHPLLAGVSFPPNTGGFNIGRMDHNTFYPGVTQVAEWADGSGFVGTKSLGSGRVIGINLQVITSDTAYEVIHQPWATRLYLNAIGIVPEPGCAALVVAAVLAGPFLPRRRCKVGR